MSNDHSWTEYAASYALDALDPDERVAFEAHLADCAICRGEVQAYQEVTGTLAYAARSATAPPRLKQRVLEEARKVRPISAASGGPAPPARRSSVLPWLLAAASLVVALGTGIVYSRERTLRVAAEDEKQGAQSELAGVRAQAARNDSLIAALIAPDLQFASLAAQGRPPTARLYYSRARNTMVLAAHNLTPAPQGRTYQLWGIPAAQPGQPAPAPVNLGVFDARPDGSARVVVTLQPGVQFGVGAVSEEPAGGSRQPTTTPFLVGRF